ncbi:pumilio homolog 5 isoform X2 [Mercurialis annua]|uniref:pumilio homolog 5 isoform X2 n=1 Tax=Mercurialis annua TaxID=3986 RepID=UPI00215FD3FF|nr:pumilio homolog 5 isoform X2 [Mercurialis annua]
MATESPMRMVESGGARNLPSSKDAGIFRAPLNHMTADTLGLLVKEHRFHRDQTDSVPSRSGSAPPSMEGSLSAIGNLLAQQNLNMTSSIESLSSALEHCMSEEQLLSDPAYLAYYSSNINLNPRLPPPLISRESHRLARHIGGFGNKWRNSVDDSGNKSLQVSTLSTHKEEPEDEKSSPESPESNTTSVLGQNSASLAGRHKSLVDLIQEDFPRTPSPVFSQSRSSSHAAEEAVELETVPSNVSSVNISKSSESNSGSSDVCVDTFPLEVDAIRLISDNHHTVAPFASSPSLDEKPAHNKDGTTTKNTSLEGNTSFRGALQSDIAQTESRMRNKQEEQQSYGMNAPHNHQSVQQGHSHQAEGVQVQMISQGMTQSHNSLETLSYDHHRLSIDIQQSLHSPALNHPSYASTAAYMTGGTAFYPNFQPSSLYSPQYSMGGYALGSAYLPPFMNGYPSHGALHVPFGASGPSFDSRATSSSAGENIPHLGGLQHLGKIYGQQGLMFQPPFMNPLFMQYFQHPFGDAYGATLQQNRLASSGAPGSQIDSFQQEDSSFAAFREGQKLQHLTNGSVSMPNSGKVGITGGSYYGGPPSMDIMTQFPTAPLASPILPSSPVSRVNHFGRRSDTRFPQTPNRNQGIYPGGQGQRGVNNYDEPKRHYFLEELKSSNARKFELSDIAGHIVEFSVDQHGSRFIQQKLEHCSVEEKVSVFREVLPHASKLMTDVFGNYVIQKFFEYGSPGQRKDLADKLSGQMLQLSLQMYGCRVIQKALEVIELDQKKQLVQELDGHVMRCVHDQNGNHVIQKCIECVPTINIEFIISAFRGQVAALATHPYGCRVIQRVLEHCSDDPRSQCIVDEILESAYLLAQDQYGNYVTQHVLERGKPYERSQIISKLTGKIVQMSQHKYASNVIEKCMEHGSPAEQELLIEEIIGKFEENDRLLTMMKDQFANYVVQKVLEISNEKQREVLLDRIRIHLHALKKYTYGKHIVARFEQLCGEENQDDEEEVE